MSISIVKTYDGKLLKTKNEKQEQLVKLIDDNDIIFVGGCPGAGKTAVSIFTALDYLMHGHYQQLVITRPIVEAGEQLGFLPGKIDEKIQPYMQVLYEHITMVLGKKKESSQSRKKKGTEDQTNYHEMVKVCPLAYIRGATFNDTILILDEAQNTTRLQMKTLLTRMGNGSKFIIAGDEGQIDLQGNVRSGFVDAINRLKGIEGVAYIQFTEEDIVRHKLVKEIIKAYTKQAEE